MNTLLLSPTTPEERTKLFVLWSKIAADADSVWPALPGMVSKTPEEGSSQMMAIPPVLNRSLGEAGLGSPVELTPRAGDILFYHYLCAHAGSRNP